MKLPLDDQCCANAERPTSVLSIDSFTNSFDLPENQIFVGMPLEGLGITVVLVEIIEHRLLQMAHSGVAAAPDAPLGHFCEEPLYEI